MSRSQDPCPHGRVYDYVGCDRCDVDVAVGRAMANYEAMTASLAKTEAMVDELKAKMVRYESLDASAPILDAASVAEFAGLARSVAASHERLRAQVERDTRTIEDSTARVIADWILRETTGDAAAFLAGRIRAGEWKAGPK